MFSPFFLHGCPSGWWLPIPATPATCRGIRTQWPGGDRCNTTGSRGLVHWRIFTGKLENFNWKPWFWWIKVGEPLRFSPKTIYWNLLYFFNLCGMLKWTKPSLFEDETQESTITKGWRGGKTTSGVPKVWNPHARPILVYGLWWATGSKLVDSILLVPLGNKTWQSEILYKQRF